MPFPNTKPIPDNWNNHHRPTATATLTDSCVINRITRGAYNPATKTYGSNIETPVYSGPCRVQMRAVKQHQMTFGSQPVTVQTYLVAIEWDGDQVNINDVVTAIRSDDPLLTAQKLRVTDVQYGSAHWQRDLTCQGYGD